VERATEWINDLADAYGWHAIPSTRSTPNITRIDLHAYRFKIEFRVHTGRPSAPLNHPFQSYYLTVKPGHLGSFIAAEQWLWKLTQKARAKANRPHLPKTYRRPCIDGRAGLHCLHGPGQ